MIAQVGMEENNNRNNKYLADFFHLRTNFHA